MKKFFNLKPSGNNEGGHKFTASDRFKTIVTSIICAVAIWLMVVYINDPSITITLNDVDIRFSGEMALKEKGFVITGKSELPSISVSISGRRSDLIDYMDSVYIRVTVDSANETGEHEFATSVELPTTRLTLESGGSTTVTLNVEQLERKSIQILTRQTGSNKDFLVDSQIADDYVEISGAKSEIDNVAYGIASIDISSIAAASEGDYSYTMYDKNNAVIDSNETIEAQQATVHVKNTPYTKMSLPVIPELSSELADEYLIDTSRTVCTPSIVEVGVSPEFTGVGVGAVIDKVTDAETEFYLNSVTGLYIPYENSTVKITPVLARKQTKTLRVKVTAINVPEGMTADFAQETDVTLVCAEDVDADDVTAQIDLSGLDKGSHYVPVSVSGPRVASFTPLSLDVTLR